VKRGDILELERARSFGSSISLDHQLLGHLADSGSFSTGFKDLPRAYGSSQNGQETFKFFILAFTHSMIPAKTNKRGRVER
jgi:hypothetical protein